MHRAVVVRAAEPPCALATATVTALVTATIFTAGVVAPGAVPTIVSVLSLLDVRNQLRHTSALGGRRCFGASLGAAHAQDRAVRARSLHVRTESHLVVARRDCELLAAEHVRAVDLRLAREVCVWEGSAVLGDGASDLAAALG